MRIVLLLDREQRPAARRQRLWARASVCHVVQVDEARKGSTHLINHIIPGMPFLHKPCWAKCRLPPLATGASSGGRLALSRRGSNQFRSGFPCSLKGGPRARTDTGAITREMDEPCTCRSLPQSRCALPAVPVLRRLLSHKRRCSPQCQLAEQPARQAPALRSTKSLTCGGAWPWCCCWRPGPVPRTPPRRACRRLRRRNGCWSSILAPTRRWLSCFWRAWSLS